MVVPVPRDPDVTREILSGWLGDPARLPGARITDLRTPEFTGFSSEIFRLTSSTAASPTPWRSASRHRTARSPRDLAV